MVKNNSAMKRFLLFLFGLTFTLCASAQIKNPGFELSQSNSTAPQDWYVKAVDGFTVATDDQNAHSGRSSLKIEGKADLPSSVFNPFSQQIDINVPVYKRVNITLYIKTRDVKQTAAIYCQVNDGSGRRIAFQNSEQQHLIIKGTTDWQKYSLTMPLYTDAKKLTVGAYLTAGGTAWFDDMAIEDIPTSDTPPSPEVKKFTEEFTTIIKKNAIYADSLDWKKIDANIETMSMGVSTVPDAQFMLDYVIAQLHLAGDNHSFFQDKVAARNYASGNTPREQPQYKLMPGDIGYILVPAFGSTSDTASVNFATKIQDYIRELDTQNNIKGWIVDMRTNGGGNMWPMIAGLGPLIGNGTLGYFISKGKNNGAPQPWFYHDGISGQNGRNAVKVSPYIVKDTTLKIAVLVGPLTASSGEMTSMTFTGKPNAKLIGQLTGGYTTANRGFPLSTGAMIYLATGYTANRDYKKYFGKMTPDIIIPVSDNDDQINKAAMDWLTGK